MTPGARPRDRENPGRVGKVAKVVQEAGRRGAKMQQSRAGSIVTGRRLTGAWNAQIKNIDYESFEYRNKNGLELGLLLPYW